VDEPLLLRSHRDLASLTEQVRGELGVDAHSLAGDRRAAATIRGRLNSAIQSLMTVSPRPVLRDAPGNERGELEDRWGVRWRDVKGLGHKKVFSRLRDAMAHLLDEDGKRGRGEWHDPKGARRTLASVFEEQTTSKTYAAATLNFRRAVWSKYVEPKFGTRRSRRSTPSASRPCSQASPARR
jgi:hypothetical protein